MYTDESGVSDDNSSMPRPLKVAGASASADSYYTSDVFTPNKQQRRQTIQQ
jgi:hypothetical protein